MTAYRHLILSLLFVSLSLLAVGCDRLQPGYYLTPDHFPTQPVPQAGAVTPSATPVSTVLAVATLTLTPEGATAAPTPTFTPSPTETMQPCTETEGLIVQAALFSAAANHDVRYHVYLPPCYSITDRRYPVIYMLHGLGEGMDDGQWFRMGLNTAADLGFTSGSLPPMIIVTPNGNDANYIWDEGPFPETMVNELMPEVERAFCTWNEPAMRAIGGLSRGGYWAYWIAFSHPELFGKVGGHSPYFYTPGYASDKNPFNLVDSAPGIEAMSMYLDHGGENREILEVRPGVTEFVARLQARSIHPEYVANPVGNHDETYWSAHTADYLEFYAAGWPHDVLEYPSCHQPSP